MSTDSFPFKLIYHVKSRLPWYKLEFKIPFESLPFEIICLVASNLPRYKDILSLMRCNRMLHDTVIYVLYKQDRHTTYSVLRWLMERGFETGIQAMISRNNLDVNMPVDIRSTLINRPLLLAIRFGRTNIMELLLRNGAQVNIGTDISALGYAATLGDYNMALLLLQHGAHVDLVDGIRCVPPLGCALRYGPKYQIQWDNLAWVDPLKYKGENDFVAVIQLLLAHGADSNFQSDGALTTCLHMIPESPWKSTEKVFGTCLNYGADLNARNWQGDTPLHTALSPNAFCGDTKVQREFVELLLRSGADVNLQNRHGQTPLGITFEDPSILELFLKPGANTRYHGKIGAEIILRLLRIPLRKQKKSTNQHKINDILIELLVERGACTDQIIDGKCPLDQCAARTYQVLKDLSSRRKKAPSKVPSEKSLPKKVSQALTDSGLMRKATDYKRTPNPARKLPPRKVTKITKSTKSTK